MDNCKRILLVCTGNTCRSPMAEGLLRALARERGQAVEVLSAGLCADGSPASPQAVAVMAERGIDISRHVSHPVTPELCAAADVIGVMSAGHRDLLIRLFAVPAEKVVLLGGGIPDPFGGTLEDYRRTRDALEKAVRVLLPNCRIVRMEERHIEPLAALEKAVFSTPWTADGLREELQNPLAVFLVAEDAAQGAVLGYIGLHHVLDEGFVTNLAVDPARRREGNGGALLQAACAYGREHGLSRLALEVRAGNREAIALYEAAGFTRDGLRPGFYDAPREDAVLYSYHFR